MNKIILLILKLAILLVAGIIMLLSMIFSYDSGTLFEIWGRILIWGAITYLFLLCLFKEEINLLRDFLSRNKIPKGLRWILYFMIIVTPTVIIYLIGWG